MTADAGPVVLRIKLRYDSVDTMALRFAANVGKSGLFLPTKSMQPVGSEIKFELRLADGTPVLVGVGKVRVAKEPDPADARAAYGLAIALTRVTRESRDVMMRILEQRREQGLPDVAIPMPEDVDAARNAVPLDTGPVVLSGPLSGPVSAPVPMPITDPWSGRMAEGTSGSAPVLALAPALPPEPSRRARPAVQEVLDRASAPVAFAPVPDLDDQRVDVAAAVARARLLVAAGDGDLDEDLDSLLAPAVPIALDVEAASAGLARQLGGHAVRRWAPPPAVIPAPAAVIVPEEITYVGEPAPRDSDPALAEADAFEDEPSFVTTVGDEDDLGIRDAVAADFVASFDHGGRIVPVDDEPGEVVEILEIEDFEIIAEADASDADLLASDGESDSAARPLAHTERPSFLDFASRLDLDSRELPAVPEEDPRDSAFGELDELTRASLPPGEAFDDDHGGFDAPHAHGRPAYEEHVPRAPAPRAPAAEEDLESALEALDVDLDDLSIPHASTELVRPTDPGSQRTAGRPSIRPPSTSQQPVRARTEDGILIDFDDVDDREK
jgi:hypothetical protein